MRAAIVGCGRAGTQHAEAIATAGGLVVAVHDTDPARARHLSDAASAPIRSLMELLEDPAVDVVAVCTTPDSHLSLGLQALAAGKAAVIEKPPALSTTQVEELKRAHEQHSRPLAVMLQHRGRLPAEALGTLWSSNASAVVEVFRHRPAEHYGARTWRGDLARSAGGFFAHLAIHYADLACQVLGEPQHILGVVEATHCRGADIRESLSVQMRSGALLTISASSLPGRRHERLSVFDGVRALTITDRWTRYRGNERDLIVAAPTTGELRAEVYREVRYALRHRRPVNRFSVDRFAGTAAILQAILEAMSTSCA